MKNKPAKFFKGKRQRKQTDGGRRRATVVPPTTEIVRVAPLPEKPWQIQGEELTILKNAICKGASDTELQYCLTVAKRYKLDPFKRQIWFVPRWDKEADNGKGGKGTNVWVPQVGIDGLLFMSARDHNGEFGTVSEPEFGPMHKPEGQKFEAPEWAKVKVFKKGIAEPTTAVAYWDEYAPFDLSKAPFWRKMPRRMLSKCATALALRQSYPDLGGVYIPEEMERMSEDYTESGRQITAGVPTGGSHEAAQAVAQRKIAEASQKIPPAQIVKEKQPERQWQGTVELDWSENEASPILRGDIGNLLEVLKPHCTLTWQGDWWHCVPRDAETIRAACDQLSFRLKEIMPKKVSPASSEAKAKGAVQGKAQGGTPSAQTKTASSPRKEAASPAAAPSDGGPVLVSGTIEAVAPKDKRVDVKLKMATTSVWMSAWDKAHHPFLVKDAQCELYVTKREKGDKVFVNIVGLKRVGVTEFDEDGKTSTIQNSKREAGQKTLYG